LVAVIIAADWARERRELVGGHSRR
jgi:hypothetical protein